MPFSNHDTRYTHRQSSEADTDPSIDRAANDRDVITQIPQPKATGIVELPRLPHYVTDIVFCRCTSHCILLESAIYPYTAPHIAAALSYKGRSHGGQC